MRLFGTVSVHDTCIQHCVCPSLTACLVLVDANLCYSRHAISDSTWPCRLSGRASPSSQQQLHGQPGLHDGTQHSSPSHETAVLCKADPGNNLELGNASANLCRCLAHDIRVLLTLLVHLSAAAGAVMSRENGPTLHQMQHQIVD